MTLALILQLIQSASKVIPDVIAIAEQAKITMTVQDRGQVDAALEAIRPRNDTLHNRIQGNLP